MTTFSCAQPRNREMRLEMWARRPARYAVGRRASGRARCDACGSSRPGRTEGFQLKTDNLIRACQRTSHLVSSYSRLAAQTAAAWLVRVVRLQGRGTYVLAHHGALVIRIRGAVKSAVLSISLSAVTSAVRLGRCPGHTDEAVAPLVGTQVDLAVQRPEQRGIVEDGRSESPLSQV